MFTRIFQFLLFLVLILIILLAVSFWFPGVMPKVDQVRIQLQEKIHTVASEQGYDDIALDNGEVRASEDAITWEEFSPFLETLSPGDIWWTDRAVYDTTPFIPGTWTHIGLYLGTQQQTQDFFGEHSSFVTMLKPFYTVENARLILQKTDEGLVIQDISQVSNLQETSFLRGFLAFRIDAEDADLQTFVSSLLSQRTHNYEGDLLSLMFTAFEESELTLFDALDDEKRPTDIQAFADFAQKEEMGGVWMYRVLELTKKNGTVIEIKK